MAQQGAGYCESDYRQAPYASCLAALVKETLLKGQAASALVDSDEDFPLFATKEKKEAFIADKKNLNLVDNNLLRQKNLLISKHEKEAAKWKTLYRDLKHDLAQERPPWSLVQDMGSNFRHQQRQLEDALEENDDIRQALDSLTVAEMDHAHCAMNDLLALWRGGHMDRIPLDCRMQIHDWIRAAKKEVERDYMEPILRMASPRDP